MSEPTILQVNAQAPKVCPGDKIQIRGMSGEWHDTVARSGVFLNTDYVGARESPWLVVQVDHPGFDHPVNWPIADVRLPAKDDAPA